MIKKIFLVGALLCAAILPARANDIYLAQSGSGDGSSCSSPKAASFFNSSSNWGSGATQIGAGTVVHLCGSVATGLTFQGNGASGKPVVLDGTGATFKGQIQETNKAYWTIQNVTWDASTTDDDPINVIGGSFGTIHGNVIDVQHVPYVIFLQQGGGTLPHDIVISGNFMRNSSGSTPNQTDVLATEGAYNITVEGNYMEQRESDNDQHDDILQTWQKGGSSAGAPHDWTVRNNKFVLNSSAPNNKSWTMLEGLEGRFDMYNNVFVGLKGGSSGNGICLNSNGSTMVANIHDNTIVEKAGGANNLFNISGSGKFNLTNNIVYNTDAGNAMYGSGSITRTGNVWFGQNLPSCNSSEICKDPMFTNLSGNDFSLKAGSPAAGKGSTVVADHLGYPLTPAQFMGAPIPVPGPVPTPMPVPTPTPIPTPVPTPTPVPPTTSILINAGGAAYTGANGALWMADKYFTGGAKFTASLPVSGTNDSQLYQSERWGAATYNVPVSPNTYAVTLKFMESTFAAAGKRVFNVSINGTAVLTNFDIFAASGGSLIAVDKTFNVTATDNIQIVFTKGSADEPAIHAIQIVPLGSTPVPPAPLKLSCSPDGTACVTTGIGKVWTITVTSDGRTATQSGTN